MKRSWKRCELRLSSVALLVALGACGPDGGPVVTEPMPDIPETVEYDTVRIEYGDDDLVAGTGPSMLVGDPSPVAAIAQSYVRGTNLIIRNQIALLDAITRTNPNDYDDGVWTWSNLEDQRKPADEPYSQFQITQLARENFAYEWRLGESPDELVPVFSGEFRPRSRLDGEQRGLGILRYNFTNKNQVDPSSDSPTQGRVVISFRAIGGIRQVRVASFELVQQGQSDPQSGQYEYVELLDGAGRFRFGAETDFLKDGAPLEELSIDALWSRDQAGRALASLTGGSLDLNEVLLHECWDESARTSFADATPDLPGVPYEDGDISACEERLASFDLAPPETIIPQADPDVPPPHPDEEEEIFTPGD